ncbi:hypothetical protein [Rhizobium sp. IMFF44]|uniref:hypothetical protein n=1 Tax=Rhizobium sp. IMFF44 TaxID=3342350 RepID=UPI0035B84146
MSHDDDDSRIRIMHGGPFYRLASRMGMRKRGWRAFVLATLTAVVPLLMLLSTGGAYLAGVFLQDWGAWAKFLIAPVLLTLAEKPIASTIDECTNLLFRVPLIATVSNTDATRAIEDARTRSTSGIAEAASLLVALAASSANACNFLSGGAPPWATSQSSLTVAGIWCLLVSNTIYWFLLSRLIWKHLVWASFLADVAECHLRLVVTHPDGHAGLGFLGLYPTGYSLFTLAVSCVAAASIGHVVQHESMTATFFTMICAGWLTVVTLYYALPLVGLAIRITQLKKKAILAAMIRATNYERWNERAILGANMCNDEKDEQFIEVHDARPIWVASTQMSSFLINRGNLWPLLLPALLPLAATGASFLPYSQLGSMVKRLLLL